MQCEVDGDLRTGYDCIYTWVHAPYCAMNSARSLLQYFLIPEKIMPELAQVPYVGPSMVMPTGVPVQSVPDVKTLF